MKIQRVIVLFGLLCCIHMLSAENVDVRVHDDNTIDDTLEAWSCGSDITVISEDYLQKVSDLLDVMEVDIMTHSSWDLMCRMTGGTSEDVVGSAGCLHSQEMKTREDCYACILEARGHLARRCPKNMRGSVFLKSCTLTYARVERTSQQRDWEEEATDDDNVPDRLADW